MARVQRLLKRNKKYPKVARSNRFQGVVYVRFTLNREGRVVGSQITQSSCQVILDDEVMGLVNRVNPFPTFPKEMEDILVFKKIFVTIQVGVNPVVLTSPFYRYLDFFQSS
ncbi:MAG: TonB family protein [Deltaproteobacteria bacterium]|jgi:TonB family protein|nr:TonB family protein [Deltaproteobacteria bacterium]